MEMLNSVTFVRHYQIEKLLVELRNMHEDGFTATKGIRLSSLSNGGVEEPAASIVESRSRLLERIASEMNRLNFFVARIQVTSHLSPGSM